VGFLGAVLARAGGGVGAGAGGVEGALAAEAANANEEGVLLLVRIRFGGDAGAVSGVWEEVGEVGSG
jgi:hypothetical protein